MDITVDIHRNHFGPTPSYFVVVKEVQFVVGIEIDACINQICTGIALRVAEVVIGGIEERRIVVAGSRVEQSESLLP